MPCPGHAKDSSGAEVQGFRNSPSPFHLAFQRCVLQHKTGANSPMVSSSQLSRVHSHGQSIVTCLHYSTCLDHYLLLLHLLIFLPEPWHCCCRQPQTTLLHLPCGFSLPCAECSSFPVLISHFFLPLLSAPALPLVDFALVPVRGHVCLEVKAWSIVNKGNLAFIPYWICGL